MRTTGTGILGGTDHLVPMAVVLAWRLLAERQFLSQDPPGNPEYGDHGDIDFPDVCKHWFGLIRKASFGDYETSAHFDQFPRVFWPAP